MQMNFSQSLQDIDAIENTLQGAEKRDQVLFAAGYVTSGLAVVVPILALEFPQVTQHMTRGQIGWTLTGLTVIGAIGSCLLGPFNPQKRLQRRQARRERLLEEYSSSYSSESAHPERNNKKGFSPD